MGNNEFNLNENLEATANSGNNESFTENQTGNENNFNTEGVNNYSETHTQSAEDNRRFAEMRRKNENRELKNRMEQFAKRMGYSSFSELERSQGEKEDTEYKTRFEEQSGIGYDIVSDAIKREINSHPDVVAARRIREESERESFQKAFDAELKEIASISGLDIKEAADLRNLPNFEEFDSFARQGVGILNAFKVSHTDLLVQNAEKKAAQKTLNNISSKSHLTSTKGGAGNSEVIVPEEIRKQYRLFNPGITDEEIIKDYAKAMKRNNG